MSKDIDTTTNNSNNGDAANSLGSGGKGANSSSEYHPSSTISPLDDPSNYIKEESFFQYLQDVGIEFPEDEKEDLLRNKKKLAQVYQHKPRPTPFFWVS